MEFRRIGFTEVPGRLEREAVVAGPGPGTARAGERALMEQNAQSQSVGEALLDGGTLVRVLERIREDLSLVTDREIVVGSPSQECEHHRPAGAGCVHLSFRIRIDCGRETSHGCLLMPLPEAVSLAAYLMMLPDGNVHEQREREDLDAPTKDALLEIGNFVAGACDVVVRDRMGKEASASSEGCQGVRPGVRPAFPYEEGAPIAVVRAQARIHDHPEFELILMQTVPGASAPDAALPRRARKRS